MPVALPHDAILFSKCGEVEVVKATSKIGHVGLKLLNFVLGSSPSPNNKKRIVVHFFFQFQGSLQPEGRYFPGCSRGEGLGWDYWSSKNTTLLVVTRQHPGGGGVHIYPPRERENISNLWKKKIIDSEVTAGNLIC